MIQIEEHNCKNKREAEAIEHYWVEILGTKLNSNKPYAMCKEEPQLYKKCWYEEKKDYILEKSKQNYEENKEQKLEYQKQYAKENKEKIIDYQEDYREKNKTQLYEQKKIYRAEHKEEASEAHKAWRESNKEKIKEQKKQIIDCECGCKYTSGNKHRHLKTKVHKDFVNLTI
jgi:glucosamine 6-phosphate synthetase-like amidotransferase/phosphosugar isomerase protein